MTDDRLGTPLWLSDALQKHFGKFDLDLAAEPWSAVVPRYVTEQQDVFRVKPKAKHAYLNPPYSSGQLDRFVGFARQSVLEGRIEKLSMLVPAYSGEGWWSRHVERPEGRVLKAEWRFGQLPHERLRNWTRLVSEHLIIDVVKVAKRITHRFPPVRYLGARESARFSSVIVRFVAVDRGVR